MPAKFGESFVARILTQFNSPFDKASKLGRFMVDMDAGELIAACSDESADAGITITSALEPLGGPVKPAGYEGGARRRRDRIEFGLVVTRARRWLELGLARRAVHGPQRERAGSYAHPAAAPYERLISAYSDQVRALLQWGLPNRDRLVPTIERLGPDRDLPNYMIGELGRVGNAGTVALLHTYLPDPDLGPVVVEAIRTIELRLADNTNDE